MRLVVDDEGYLFWEAGLPEEDEPPEDQPLEPAGLEGEEAPGAPGDAAAA